ncbi:hypothetical protein KF840_21875 [bacterium]|nr:hypothetical protein [bacterium]
MKGRASAGASEVGRGVAAMPKGDATPRAAGRAARVTMRWAWAAAVVVLVLLDVTFDRWFWRIPKLTPASTDRGYQFLVDARALANTPKTPGVPRVLAVGSATAGAFDPAQVRTLLEAGGTPADVHRLVLPGSTPSELRRYFAADGAALDLDVVVVLLTPLDFRQPRIEYDRKPQVPGVLPPADTWRERRPYAATAMGTLDRALAATSNLYRHRAALRACIEDHLRWARRWLASGRTAGGFGWYPDGYAQQRFAVPLPAAADGFAYYIDPAWVAQRGRVTLTFAAGEGPALQRTESAAGWYRVALPAGGGTGDLLSVSADSAWSPRAAGYGDDTRLLGVRLSDVPAAAPARDGFPVHYPPLERDAPDMLLRMGGASGDELERRWQALLEADTELGRRLRADRDGAIATRGTAVREDGEYAALDGLLGDLTTRGARVVLINNPESELLRAQYADSSYYRGYLEFLSRLAARTPGTELHDLGPALPADDFNDWRQVTYIGAMKLGATYADLVRDALAAPTCR